MRILLTIWFFLYISAANAEPLKIAFIYVSPVGDAGWSYSHDLGRQYLEQIYGDQIQTTKVESVPEGRKSRVVLEQLAQENDIIFSTSWGYMISAEHTAENFPSVKFEHATGLRRGGNLSTYATRAYEARYLSGMIAAAMSKSGQIGYVAAFPIAEVLRGINAFTLGAQRISPDIQVNVEWTNAWYAPDVSRAVSHHLIDAGADVLAHHVDTATPVIVAEERGVYAIGYHTDMSEFGLNSHLASVTHNWGKLYASRINALKNETWNAEDLWPGLKQQSSGLVGISKDIPSWVIDEVDEARQGIISGKLKIFAGPIENHRGRVRVKLGKELEDDDLQRMNWYVAGVKGDLKFY